MSSPLIMELLRQLLRLIGLWLVTLGLPAELAGLLEHPEAAAFTAGLISYAMAEAGWIIAKLRQWRARE